MTTLKMLQGYGRFINNSNINKLHNSKYPEISFCIATQAFATKAAMRRITNYKATQLLKQMYTKKRSDQAHGVDNIQTVQQAMNIYDQIHETKNHFVINTLLRLGLHFNQIDIILPHIWNDVRQIKSSVSYPLLLKCCVESESINTKNTIKILKWMKQNKVDISDFDPNELKMFTSNLSQLLSKCDDIQYVQKIHSYIGNVDDVFIKNLLIKAYGEFDDIQSAINIFRGIDDTDKDTVTLNSMLSAYGDCGWNKDLLRYYKKYESLQDDISHLLAIKACTNLTDKTQGQDIIDTKLTLERGLSKSLGLNGALINFYGTFGEIKEAEYIYDSIPERKLSSITIGSMLKAYIINNCNEKALDVYLNVDSKLLNDVCHILGIQACINLGDKAKYETMKYRLHWKLSRDLDGHGIELKNALIDFYGTFGDFKDALNVFNSIKDKHKTIVTISSMMNTYCNNDMNQDCVELFRNMKEINDKLEPDIICYTTVIKACGQGTLLHVGQEIHNEIKQRGDKIIEDISIKINLINMYGKCGMMDICEELFDSNIKDISFWNAMINAYGVNNQLEKAKDLLNKMKELQMDPDSKTYISLIHCCGHSGNLDEARRIWEEIDDEQLKYNYYVVTSLIDSYSRKGLVQDAYDLLLKYDGKYETDIIMWMAVLNGCSKYKNTDLAIKVYEQMTDKFDEKDKKMASAAILMSNLYAS